MQARVPGEGRYAQPEREQRWLLDSLPDERRDPVEIIDHYLTATRLRLRRMQSGQEVIWKLSQKVRRQGGSPELVQLTNMYLNEQEYCRFLRLDASILTKTRWHWDIDGRTMSVDALHGDLEGLALAEMEIGLDDDLLGFPPMAIAEVTIDDRFSGGALAALDKEGAEVLMRSIGQMRRGPRPE
jgi:hypothetical protein